MSLPYSQIEYSFRDGKPGRAWNFLRGCSNGPDICKTRETCWAKALAVRFRKGDFTPTFDLVAFSASFPIKPARILVCFTGDISYATLWCREEAVIRMFEHPEHRFLLLTKRPAQAYADIPSRGTALWGWPRNALLMASLTGAEAPERQQQVMDELRAVKGEHRLGISYEPMLGPLTASLEGIHWLVMGAQTGRRAQSPIADMIPQPKDWHGQMWFKNNLERYFKKWGLPWPPRQEFPQEVV